MNKVRVRTASAAAVVITAGLADDSGTASGGDSAKGIAHAKAQLDAATAAPTFKAPGPAFDVSGVRGKTMFVIPAANNEFDTVIQDQMKKLASEYGVKYTNYANQGTPNEWVAGFNTALSQNPDLIVLNSALDPNQVKAQMQLAKEKGIPVLATHFYDDDFARTLGTSCGGTQELCDIGLSGTVNAPFNAAMQLSADYAIADSDGKAHGLLISANDAAPSKAMIAAAQKEFADNCPGCKVTVRNVAVADWATKIQPLVQAELARDPNLKYVIPIFDFGASFVESGINAAGKSGQVKIASYNGTANVLKQLGSGSAVAMDVGESLPWLGYAFMDQAFRLLTKQPIVEQQTPIRVFTEDNVDEAGDPPSPDKGYGDDYIAGFKDLWTTNG
jgi:ribose transport system substrate-binding protein